MYNYCINFSNPESTMSFELLHEKEFNHKEFYDIVAKCAMVVIDDLFATNASNFDKEEDSWYKTSDGVVFWLAEYFEWQEILESSIFLKELTSRGFEALMHKAHTSFYWGENIDQHSEIGKQMGAFMKEKGYSVVSNGRFNGVLRKTK